MSTKDPNLKVIFGADTKDFDKGAKQVKQGLKDLDKSSESMLSSLSNAFGVSSGKVEQMTSAVRGLGYKLVETGNEGAKALGSVLAKIGPLQAGIAGLGLAGAIAGFKALKVEADNFKSTIDGVNMSMATAAYLSTYKQVLHDLNSDTGKQVAEAMDQWERGFGRFKANLSATFVTTVGGQSKWYDAILPTGIIRGWKEATANSKAAAEAAERNADRQNKITELKKDELTLTTQVKENEAAIAEYRRQAVDPRNNAATRAEAEANARALVNKNFDDQIALAQELARLQIDMDKEANNTFEETKHTEELKQRILDLETQRTQELQKLDKVQNRITNSANAEAAARQKAAEETQKLLEYMNRRQEMNDMQSVLTSGLPTVQGKAMGPVLGLDQPTVDAFKKRFTADFGEMTVYVGFLANTDSIKDITNEVNSLLESSIMRTSEIMGNLIGTLASGGNAWGDFKNAAVSALGDMAIAIGKIAIKSGVAMLGIQAALKLDNPYVAIAAGAALVALGSAVKSSLSAVASGDYSAGGGGYSGSYSSGSSGGNWETRDVNVNVTGTLTASGDQLITVINNTNKKNYYTQ